MNLSLFRACQLIGVPPPVWTVRNAIKIYEFVRVVSGAGLERQHEVLDLGCGEGHWTHAMARRCASVVGVDPSPSRIELARSSARHSRLRRRASFQCTRLEEAGLRSASFDRVISLCVLEHIDNLDTVLAEVARILRPGGQLHVSVDSLAGIEDPLVIARHQRECAVVQYFDRRSLQERFARAGLKTLEVVPILRSDFARAEFERRMRGRYSQGPLARLRLYRRLRDEDRRSDRQEGIFLVGRAERPGGR